MFEIREIVNKKEWEDFLTVGKPHTFLHSWNWGEFNESMNYRIWRLGIYKKKFNLIGLAFIIKISARRGTFLFCPHGPLFKNDEQWAINDGLKNLVDYLKDSAKKENCSFIRISPLMIKTPETEELFENLGFRRAPIHTHAELVWMLDISLPENELLKNMRKTTRYLIRKAQRDGVQIIKSGNLNDLEIFNKIYQETASRHRFLAYSSDYLKKEFEAFSKDNQIFFFFAKYNNEVISGAMIIFYGQSVFYHQGASSLKYPKIGASYLLQWEVIREAQKRGFRFYNFWGISPDNKPDHPWAGLSLFKKGFGGFSEEYLPAQDLVLKNSYWLTYLIEKIRKFKRNL